MQVIAGIDPGNRTGVAAVNTDGDLVYSSVTTATTDLREVVDNLVSVGVTSVLVEDQYVAINKSSAIKVARWSGVWIGLAIAYQLPHGIVHPQTWQRAELSCGVRTRREDRKAMSQSRCRALWNVDMRTDEADAALIARWGAVQAAEVERTRRLRR